MIKAATGMLSSLVVAFWASWALTSFASGSSGRVAGPSFVDITWMSITNMYYELGPLRIVTDGYITRLPQDAFFGGGGGLAQTRRAYKPDVAAVTRVLTASAAHRASTCF